MWRPGIRAAVWLQVKVRKRRLELRRRLIDSPGLWRTATLRRHMRLVALHTFTLCYSSTLVLSASAATRCVWQTSTSVHILFTSNKNCTF